LKGRWHRLQFGPVKFLLEHESDSCDNPHPEHTEETPTESREISPFQTIVTFSYSIDEWSDSRSNVLDRDELREEI